VVRRPAFRPEDALGQHQGWFGWGAGLSKAEREALKERVALLALSGVLAVAVLIVAGLLAWQKLYVPRQAVAVVDSQTITLGTYANTLAYKQNVLLGQLQQAQALAGQQTSPDQFNPVAQMAQQQAQQIQNQLMNLPTGNMEELIDDILIRQEAKKQGVAVSKDELDSELKQIVGYQDPDATPVPSPTAQPSEAAAVQEPTPAPAATAAATAQPTSRARRTDTFQARYRDYVRTSAGTDAIVRQDAEIQVLRRKLNEIFSASVSKTQEQVHARHILVPDETAARTVLQRLQNGESFEDLAAELSTDTSNKDKGGDLGWFPHGVMVSDFEQAAFKLQAGQVSEPVKTQFGYHIIRVDERDPNHELEPQMYDSLKNGALSRWLDQEKTNHTIARYLDSDKQNWAMQNGRKPLPPSRR